jgi:hypothetical protein
MYSKHKGEKKKKEIVLEQNETRGIMKAIGCI